ncbi:MAG: transposase [Myxococcales bacterium]|nr:transposase [Myxococcales bacterium]
MASQPAMLSAVLTALMQEVFNYQRRVARRMSVTSPQPGAIAFVQRFGSSLNLHPHIHAIVPDVVFVRADGDRLAQIPIPPPSHGDLEHLAHRMAIRVHRLFERALQRGPLAVQAAGADADDEQAALTASLAEAMPRQLAFDAGHEGDSADVKRPPARQQPDAAYVGGVSLHISQALPTNKRDRLERLLRYGARPPLASSRLTQTPSGKVAYELRRRGHTGQTHVVLEPVAFLRRLAALMPPPRVHMLRFFGVFAPRHAFRGEIATLAAQAADAPRIEPTQPQTARNTAPARYRWAQLLARVFADDLTRCQRPGCAGKVRVIAEIIDPDVIAKILSHLGLSDTAPATSAARALPPAPGWAWASP